MRHSYSQRLLEVERRQRRYRYGQKARLTQLKIAAGALIGVYIACLWRTWRHPRPIQHVWIDEVLVEVVIENWIDYTRTVVLWCGIFCLLLICVVQWLGGNAPAAEGEEAAGGRFMQSHRDFLRHLSKGETTISWRDGDGESSKECSDKSSLRLASKRLSTSAAMPNVSLHRDSTGSVSKAGYMEESRRHDATRPMRSERDLNRFLSREAQQEQRRRSSQRWGSSGDGAALNFRPVEVSSSAQSGEAIRVVYAGGGAVSSPQASTARAPASSSDTAGTIPWADLGIRNTDAALHRMREWMSDVCRRVVEEVQQCDDWFHQQQISAFDCHHSLQELIAVTAPPQPAVSSYGWGAATGTTAALAAPQFETKLAALLREKEVCRQNQQSLRDLDTTLRYEQRLSLEAKLDLGSFFPSSIVLSSSEMTARQDYILSRLHTFAKQRYLASFSNSGGDPDTWQRGFPCDAHILLHVLRASVEGFSDHVRFGYQTTAQPEDLAIYVGDTGEPYFYVRHRHDDVDALFSTRQGPTSLLEAVLVFAAVVHAYHGDVYGGLRGSMDLKKAGLLRVVAEERRSSPWDMSSA